MTRRIVGASALVIVAAIGATGCSPSATAPAAVASRTVGPASSASESPTPTPTATPPHVPTWGDTITLPSGLAFTVALEGPELATGYTEGGKYSGRTAVFKTTLRNGTAANLDTGSLVAFGPTTTAGKDGHAVQGNGWDGQVWPKFPTLLPGESFTWEWGVDDPPGGLVDLRVEYSVPRYIGGDGNPVVWRGSAQ